MEILNVYIDIMFLKFKKRFTKNHFTEKKYLFQQLNIFANIAGSIFVHI